MFLGETKGDDVGHYELHREGTDWRVRKVWRQGVAGVEQSSIWLPPEESSGERFGTEEAAVEFVRELLDLDFRRPRPSGADELALSDDRIIHRGDAIKVTFFNQFSKAEDSVRGVVERISSGGRPRETVIYLSNDVEFSPVEGGRVYIDGRSRGILSRSRPAHEAITVLFANNGGGQQTFDVDEPEEGEEVDYLLGVIQREQGELSGADLDRVKRAMIRVAGSVAEYPPSPFDDDLDDLVAALGRFNVQVGRWYRDNVGGSRAGMDETIQFRTQVMEPITQNRNVARREAIEFIEFMQ